MAYRKINSKTEKRISFIRITFFLWFLPNAANAKDLVDVISSLYEGDGVQLMAATMGFSHAPHFQEDALLELSMLAQSASDIEFPYPHASGGISFNYDPVLDDFIETVNGNSLLFTDPAKTLGKGNISAGMTYSNISFDKINGQRLSHLSLALNHEDIAGPGSDICIGGPIPSCYLFEEDQVVLDIDLEIDSEILFLYAGFGLTEKIDIEFVLPVIKNRVSIQSRARIVEDESRQFFPTAIHTFDESGNNGDISVAHATENKIGFGDLQLRSKWNFYSSDTISMATLVEVLLPTGEKDNFMGQDTLALSPSFIFSTLSGFSGIPVNAHFNLGYDFTTGDSYNELTYEAAIEYRQALGSSVLTTAFEVLGKHVLETRTGFGDDQIDAAIGSRWNFLGSHSLFFNYRFPLNDDGLRASNIFSVGYAASF